MKKVKLSYIIGENVYNSINNLTNYSKEIIGTSTNLITELSKLFDQIEDEVTSEILSEASKINDFISSISSFTKNELQEIKIKSKIAIEKAEKRKGKISMLKEENQKLKEVIKDAETEKKQLILNIDSISSQLSDMYMEKQIRERNSYLEKINKKNEEIIKEKYIKEINEMQNNMEMIKKEKKIFQNNATKYKKKSIDLAKQNGELKNELMLYITKEKKQDDLNRTIDSLRLENDDLGKKVKYYKRQIEEYKNMEERKEKETDIYIKKNLDDNFSNKKSGKIIQLKDKDVSDNDNDLDIRFKTFSNLNDLLAEESDSQMKLDSNKKSDKIYSKKKIKGNKNNFRRFSFDLDYIFEIKLNTYENFFG